MPRRHGRLVRLRRRAPRACRRCGPGLIPFPADIYLEGSDQHRGWFHSSLLLSVAGRGVAPYRQVLTHGFTVDEKGRKMSKSLGNVVAPQKVMQSLGADVLRLWVAATDYSGEISVSDEILKRMSDSYRRMRNTVRFLLGNLAGFDPARDALPADELVELDRWALARAASLQDEVVEAYRKYEFHLIYQKVHNFCVVELGAFWLDIIKDRLYTTPAQGVARRSAQTAMYHIAEAMVRWLAPILSFTAEEIWQYLPGRARRRRCSSRPGGSCPRSGRRARSTGTRSSRSRPTSRARWSRCAPPARSARRSRRRWTCISTRRSIGAWPRSAMNFVSC